MAEEDQNFESSIFKYMMRDFAQTSIRQEVNSSAGSNFVPGKHFISSDNAPTSTTSRPAPSPVLNYGTSSLFLTDYEKHDWLGYGDRYRAARNPEHDDHRELAVSNEGSLKKFSPFEEETLITMDSDSLKYERSLSDSGYMPWNLDIQEESVSPASSTPRAQTTYKVPEDDNPPPMSAEASRGEVATSKGGSLSLPLGRCQSSTQHTSQIQRQRMGVVEQKSPSSFGTPPVGPHFGWDDHGVHTGSTSTSGVFGKHYSGTIPNSVSGIPTRYLKISNLAPDISTWDIRSAIKSNGDLKGIFTAYLECHGIIFLEFFDIRHAVTACRRLLSNAAFDATAIRVQFYLKSSMSQIFPEISKDDNDGMLMLSLAVPRMTSHGFMNLLSLYGDIRSFETESDGWPLSVLVEYYDTRHAAFARIVLQELHNKKQIHCQVSFYQSSRLAASRGIQQFRQQQITFKNDSTMTSSPSSLERVVAATGWLLSSEPHQQMGTAMPASITNAINSRLALQQEASSALFLSPSDTGRDSRTTTLGLGEPYTRTFADMRLRQSSSFEEPLPVYTAHETVQNSRRDRDVFTSLKAQSYANTTISNSNNTLGDNQQVDADTRTTFMIRHIPNKYTQPMLLEWINETHFGRFDFLYLRMDFKNRCNVGYAFINFINTDVAMSFKKQHVGKRWSRFNSDKKCELSYAAIQGRHALIERFRNSRCAATHY
ncbi:hypothetical protein BGZ65_006093 [Modicella reniformis]|uniref:Mei2-like C-terminal RNA recognition motif domain-containing protein n=1 Tax=Modicella reniformis TaxID=1440133 RepID=A0A9P6LU47_9FUNG|nr:hypothetical protein BGZ65_006093 [Modicella reniformis]